MTETQELLVKISALRQRLEEARVLARGNDDLSIASLRSKLQAGSQQQVLLATTLRQLPQTADDVPADPPALTARAAHLLRRAQELRGQLRPLADNATFPSAAAEPLGQFYRDTITVVDAVLCTVQAFPPSPSAQLRLCEGLEVTLDMAGDRAALVASTLKERRRQDALCNSLAEILAALADDCSVARRTLEVIAESVQDDARQALPLWFLEPDFENLPRFIAVHSLAVAQVIAHLTRYDKNRRTDSLHGIMAALVHDVGMVKLPTAVLGQTSPLNDEQRRAIETHPILGADMASRISPRTDWLVDAAAQHHERLDGTGYPAGLRDLQINPLIRLLSVCDVYAAMRQVRPHRLALDPRTALVDTFLMADQDALDRTQAELLLHLGHYPVGTMVEMSDGSIGVVVAMHRLHQDLKSPARPVVAVWIDAGRCRPLRPRHIDLAERDDISILRGLPTAAAGFFDRRESREIPLAPALSRLAS